MLKQKCRWPMSHVWGMGWGEEVWKKKWEEVVYHDQIKMPKRTYTVFAGEGNYFCDCGGQSSGTDGLFLTQIQRE